MVSADAPGNGNRFTRFFEWVDTKLEPAFGPPPVTADDHEPAAAKPCPLCGEVMAEHTIDHSTANTHLECPTGERLTLPRVDAPLGELGMPASEERLLKLAKRRH